MPKKLLLADDSVTIQRVIELTFSGEDVQVLAVGDGEEAIARIPAEKPKREDKPAIPDDLMDIGEADLLPRESDLLPAMQDFEAAQPMVLDDSLDDYFDKLDEAFSTIHTSSSQPDAASSLAVQRPP